MYVDASEGETPQDAPDRKPVGDETSSRPGLSLPDGRPGLTRYSNFAVCLIPVSVAAFLSCFGASRSTLLVGECDQAPGSGDSRAVEAFAGCLANCSRASSHPAHGPVTFARSLTDSLAQSPPRPHGLRLHLSHAAPSSTPSANHQQHPCVGRPSHRRHSRLLSTPPIVTSSTRFPRHPS